MQLLRVFHFSHSTSLEDTIFISPPPVFPLTKVSRSLFSKLTTLYFCLLILFLTFPLKILQYTHFPMPSWIPQKHDVVWLHNSTFSRSSLFLPDQFSIFECLYFLQFSLSMNVTVVNLLVCKAEPTSAFP